MSNDTIMLQAVGELKESNKNIAHSLGAIRDNLKILNDQNILHGTESTQRQNQIMDKLQMMTARYWWLIVALIVTIIGVLGGKDAIAHFFVIG